MTDTTTQAAEHKAPPPIDAEVQILYVQPTRCQGCGALYTSSRLFDVRPHARDGRTQRPSLTRAAHLELQRIQCNTLVTPVCHACVTTNVQPITDRESWTRWQETLRRKKEQERAARVAAAPPAPKAPKETTLEDLI